MEGKLIRKYREIFSRVPQNNNTIQDILRFMEDDIRIEDEDRVVVPYKNLLEKTTLTDWLRSRGVRLADIMDHDRTIVCNVSFCGYLQCVLEYVLFLKTHAVGKEIFQKSIYSTEHSRNIATEKKYKCCR